MQVKKSDAASRQEKENERQKKSISIKNESKRFPHCIAFSIDLT